MSWGTFLIGIFTGLIIQELTDGEPVKKVKYYDRYQIRYIYRAYPNEYYYDYGKKEQTQELKHLTTHHSKEQNLGGLRIE